MKIKSETKKVNIYTIQLEEEEAKEILKIVGESISTPVSIEFYDKLKVEINSYN